MFQNGAQQAAPLQKGLIRIMRFIRCLVHIRVQPVPHRFDPGFFKQLADCHELISSLFQFRDDELQSFHGVHVPGHVMQEHDLPVLRVRQNAVDTLLCRNGGHPIFAPGAADTGQVHIVIERLVLFKKLDASIVETERAKLG